MSIESESEFNQNQKTYNNLKNKINENQNIKTKKAEPIHYYYTDPLNFQWCFTETRGSSKDYYYKCSTIRCTAFGMISKTSNISPFILTRGHSIPYYEHTYALNKYAELNFQIPEKEFIKIFNKSKIFRNSAIRDYISHTEFVTIDSTIAYLNGKGIMDIKEEYKKEIVNAINSLKFINSTKGKICDCLNNMKINNENNVCYNHLYKVVEKNETRAYNIFHIITEPMRINIIKKSIKQAFIDVSFKCVPPGLSNYKIPSNIYNKMFAPTKGINEGKYYH